MKFVDEFRDPQRARRLIAAIRALYPAVGRPLQLMEFCGGHTQTLLRYGIEQLLPEGIEMVHGPGCPVCVLPRERVDDALALAQRPEVIFATFGDAMRVPGSRQTLLQARAGGADVRMVYSPLDALLLARRHPEREVIFFALGFETTMPATALTVLQAARQGIGNFSLFCNHITTLPTLRAVLEDPHMRLDGLLAPGHVSMVVGMQPFVRVAAHYRLPIVISGFEPLDMLQSLWLLLGQLVAGRHEVENQYARVVPAAGNTPGLAAVARVFGLQAAFDWDGSAAPEGSGVRMREEYACFDAERRFPVAGRPAAVPAPPQCEQVLMGRIRPQACRYFGSACTPRAPMGALMVSAEGACAACYRYGDSEQCA